MPSESTLATAQLLRTLADSLESYDDIDCDYAMERDAKTILDSQNHNDHEQPVSRWVFVLQVRPKDFPSPSINIKNVAKDLGFNSQSLG